MPSSRSPSRGSRPKLGSPVAGGSLTTSVQALFQTLRGLSPSGSDGFEGFVADAFSEVTGRTFRLVKPGPQGGADLLSGATAGEAVLAVEAKRFQEGTQLPLDALQAKLVDLAHSRPEADLWMLVASRQVSADDVAKLEVTGAGFGLDVLVVDTRPDATGLPPLAVLCAAAPQAIAAQFPGQPALAGILAAIRSNPGFAAAIDRMQTRLASPEIGYDAARTAMAGWMREAMSDLATAKGQLGSHADLRADGERQAIDRATATAHMDAVVAHSSVPRALLGFEGVGKTWAILRWWDTAAGEYGLGLPLTVWLPASRVAASMGLLATACAALAERTGTRTAAFWEARLRRWRRAGGTRLLLVVDGLNQNFIVKSWTELVQPLFGLAWRGAIAVALTSRPDHWAQQGSLADLVPPPATAELGPFNDAELDTMLGLHGLTRDGLPPELLKLMRTPRLFSLAARFSGKLEGVGELTPERLVLEDWRDRVGLYGNRIGLSIEEFRRLASTLGSRLKIAMAGSGEMVLTRRELIEELGRDSGYGQPELAGAVSELVDGRWLAQTGPHRFRLEGAPARLAMGLTLLDVVQGKVDEASAAEAIADFVDPLRGADLGVAVLRAATTASIVEPGVPALVQRALLLAWLSSQNFGRTDFEAFWRLVGLDPALFIGIADEGWRSSNFDPRQDEVMGKALANASKWEGAATAVDAALRLWMSAVPLPDTQEDARRVHRALEALRRIPSVPGANLLHAEAEPDGWLNTCRNALTVCSFRRRAPVADAYAAWALAGAITGGWVHPGLVDWTLRLNEEDADETGSAILATSRGLATAGESHAHAAARRLLHALATRAATDLAATAGCPVEEAMGLATPSHPVEAGLALSAEGVVALGAAAGDTDASLDQPQVRALIEFCRSAPLQALAAAFADGVTRGAVPALARWAPAEIDGYMLRLADAAADEVRPGAQPPKWLAGLRECGPGLAGLLSAEARGAMVAACSDLPLPHRPDWVTGSATTALACYGRTPEEQLEVIASAFPIGITRASCCVLNPLPPDAVLRAARERWAERPEGERLEYWLRHLWWSRDIWGLPPPEPLSEFLALTTHDDVKVRALAMTVLHRSRNCGIAAVKFAGSGWQWTAGMEREEAANGSILLLSAAPTLGSAVLDHADPQIAVAAFHEDPCEVGRLVDFLRREVAHILGPGSHSSSRQWCRDDMLEGFVECEPDEAERLMQPAISPSRSRSTFLFMGFPAMGLCQGLLKQRPNVGAALWRSLMDEQDDGITKRGDLALMPFKVGRSELIEGLREHALSRARNDAALASIAHAATADEGDSWLEEVIVRDLERPAAAKAGRSLVLAGYMHATPRARALWLGRLARSPAPGWLETVHAAAHRAFHRHLDALHWLDAFFSARNQLDASATYALFASRADHRAMKQCTRRLDALCPDLLPVQLLRRNLDVGDFNKREEDRTSAREKLFAATPRVSELGPWA